MKWTVKAGGALALFIIVFFFTPEPPAVTESVEQTMIGNHGTQIGKVKDRGVVNIGGK